MFSLIILFLLGGTLLLPAQEYIPLTVSQGAVRYELEIGFHPNAGDTFDPGLDLLAPPPPPAFFAFLQWKNVAYFRDLRSHISSPDTFRVRYLRSGNEPVIVTWDPAGLPANRDFVITDDFDLNGFRLDMKAAGQLIADDHPLLFDQLRILVVRDPLGVDQRPENLSGRVTLDQNYPNPFNPETVITYRLPAAGEVQIIIFTAAGQRVKKLIDQRQPAGIYTARWDGRDAAGRPAASGVYFYQLRTGAHLVTKKMLLIR